MKYLTQAIVNPFTGRLDLALKIWIDIFLGTSCIQIISYYVTFPKSGHRSIKSSNESQGLCVSKRSTKENITVEISMKNLITRLKGHFLFRIQFGYSSYLGFSFSMWPISYWYNSVHNLFKPCLARLNKIIPQNICSLDLKLTMQDFSVWVTDIPEHVQNKVSVVDLSKDFFQIKYPWATMCHKETSHILDISI